MKLMIPQILPSALGGPGCGAGVSSNSSVAASIAVFSLSQASSQAPITALGDGASGESVHFCPRAYSCIQGKLHLSPSRASTIARAQVTWHTIH
jgi:hypothetical protein